MRSRAWHWLFSSQHSTNARSGGFKYKPITSQNFVSKFLSLESLNVRVRCGLMSLALQRRWTVALETPALWDVPEIKLAGGFDALRELGAPVAVMKDAKERLFAA